jgi:hypothetical protein
MNNKALFFLLIAVVVFVILAVNSGNYLQSPWYTAAWAFLSVIALTLFYLRVMEDNKRWRIVLEGFSAYGVTFLFLITTGMTTLAAVFVGIVPSLAVLLFAKQRIKN